MSEMLRDMLIECGAPIIKKLDQVAEQRFQMTLKQEFERAFNEIRSMKDRLTQISIWLRVFDVTSASQLKTVKEQLDVIESLIFQRLNSGFYELEKYESQAKRDEDQS